MATTYGYGGEFSSDEDIDRVEQQAERLVQSRFNQDNDANSKPTVQQIEDTIEAIRSLSPEEDINLSDDVLASLLDHFKTQRGPIVDSTRKLYKKIVLRIIRDGEARQTESTGASNDNNHNNNNDMEIITKHRPQVIDSFSSDEDEPMPPIIQETPRRNPVQASNGADDAADRMEIDSETPKGVVRETKQVDISTDDEEEDNDDDDDESSISGESEEELHSKSDVLEMTPIKPQKNKQEDKARLPGTPRIAESSSKRQPLAHSTPKESVISTAKKPYTRSQRLAATRAATSSEKASDSFIGSKSAATSSNDGTKQSSRRKFILIAVAMIFAVLAAFVYHHRANIIKTPSSSSGILFSSTD